MLKKFASFAFVTAGIFAFAQGAAADEKLFKDYVYQSPLAGYTQAAGYHDCSEEVGGPARCKDDVDFLGEKFTMVFNFADEKLSTITLVADFSQDLYGKAVAGLTKTFTLVSMTDDKSIFDVVEVAKKASNQADLMAKVSNYETLGLNSGNLTYTFVEGAKYNGQPNAVSLMMASPENARASELIVSTEDDQTSLLIRFSFPRLENNRMAEAAKKPVESF